MNDIHFDGQNITIVKDDEDTDSVDYFFKTTLFALDPRSAKGRNISVGERYGLVRIRKKSMDADLLFPIPEDPENKCFHAAVYKIKKEYSKNQKWPDKAQYAAG